MYDKKDVSCDNCANANDEGTCLRDWKLCWGSDYSTFGYYLFEPKHMLTSSYHTHTMNSEVQDTLTYEKMQEVIKELYAKTAAKTDDALMQILVQGGNPLIVHRQDDPFNVYVVDQSSMYFNPLKPLEPKLEWCEEIPESIAGNLEDGPIEFDPCEYCDDDPHEPCDGCVFDDDACVITGELDACQTEPEKVWSREDDWDAECGTKEEAKSDVVDHPSHYAEAGLPSGIECWDHYELGLTEEEFVGAMKGNIYKYLFRAGRKYPDKAVEDLKKAKAYLNRLIDYVAGQRTVWMKGQKANDI